MSKKKTVCLENKFGQAVSISHNSALVALLGPCIPCAAPLKVNVTFQQEISNNSHSFVATTPHSPLLYLRLTSCVVVALLRKSEGYTIKYLTINLSPKFPEINSWIRIKEHKVQCLVHNKVLTTLIQLSWPARHTCVVGMSNQIRFPCKDNRHKKNKQHSHIRWADNERREQYRDKQKK